MPDTIKVTRRALYERIWSEPVIKLAREFGLSDVGFPLCPFVHFVEPHGRMTYSLADLTGARQNGDG